MTVPSFGVGTFRLTGDTVVESVVNALELGYRAIDTAQIYGNESDIGKAIRQADVSRRELYITTKVWVDNYSKEKFITSVEESISKLGVDYLDLLLIHWPAPSSKVDMEEYLLALAETKRLGLAKEIGVSNFTISLLDKAVSILGAENIVTNQIELSPYLQNRKLVSHMDKLGIKVTSYMTLAYGEVLKDEKIISIASSLNISPAQLILAWALQKGYSVIPSSTKRENLESNLQSLKISLSEEVIREIDSLERNGRLVDPEGLAPEWDL